MTSLKIVLAYFLLVLRRSVPDLVNIDYGSENNCTCVPERACNDNTTDFIGLVDVKFFKYRSCPNYYDVCCQNLLIPETSPTETDPASKCGYKDNSNDFGYRILGNNSANAEFAEFPWTVLILHKEAESNKSVYKCGGSLIHPRVILTAAHCMNEEFNGYWIIRAGEWNTKIQDEPLPHQDRLAEDFTLHPEYNPDSLKNDVALLFLNEPFKLARNIKIICLPRPNWKIEKIKCIAAGWGKNAFKKGKHSTILKKIEIPLVPNSDCVTLLRQTRLGKFYNMHQSFICAGGELNRDTCKGDGGSPLVCPISELNGRYFQAGIVSWGIGCGENNTPGVYVNVALFITWIDSELSAKNIDTNSYKF